MNKTDLFLSRIDEVKAKAIPAEVIDRTKLALLDYIGVTLAGLHEHRAKVDSLVESFCDRAGDVRPLGLNIPMSINNAVFLNGLNGHALDFDDGTNAGIIHLGSPLFSVLLALAQKYPVSGEQLLKAAVLGYETSFTMAMTIQPTHKQRGYHATATCGLLGIAVAVSELLGYNEKQRKDAFSTAAASATGTLKVLEDGSQLKPYNVGKTALLGLIATQMAKAGFDTADDALAGMAGFLSQMHGDEDVPFVSPLLNGTYAVQKAYIKPYAACRYTHPSIDVAREMRATELLTSDQIESIHIKTYALAVKKHDHTDIKGAASAKMSIPYNFAVTYVLGRTGMEAFTEDSLNDPEVQAITKKIVTTEDADMTAAFPKETIATVEMVLKDGRVISGKSILPKGEPENPLTRQEAIDKFTALAIYGGKTEAEAAAIAEAVLDVENSLDKLIALL